MRTASSRLLAAAVLLLTPCLSLSNASSTGAGASPAPRTQVAPIDVADPLDPLAGDPVTRQLIDQQNPFNEWELEMRTFSDSYAGMVYEVDDTISVFQVGDDPALTSVAIAGPQAPLVNGEDGLAPQIAIRQVQFSLLELERVSNSIANLILDREANGLPDSVLGVGLRISENRVSVYSPAKQPQRSIFSGDTSETSIQQWCSFLRLPLFERLSDGLPTRHHTMEATGLPIDQRLGCL